MASERLNVTDVCDAVEFHESADGMALYGQAGRWAPSTQRGGKKMDYVTHLKPDGTYQPLREHEENVAALAGEFAAAFGAQEHGHRTGLLHDIGKYSANGQKRQRDPAHTAKVDHASAGAQMAWQMRDCVAAFAVAGHHGGLPDRGDKTNDGGGTLCARLNKHLTGGNDPSAWKTEIEIPAKARFPAWLAAEKDARRLAMYTRMLFSCLVDADYLDTETAIQGGQPRGEGETTERLLEKLNAHVAPWLEAPANELCAKRSAILARCLRGGEDERGLYTLTVPTGGGKTISSLAFALSHAAKHGLKRVIYVVPYTSIILQNTDVFDEVLGAENVLEHHSQVEFADDGEETSEAYRKRLACENWDAPVVVTTAVQFFESLYAAKTPKCRKLHNITNSVVIFDEAQTIPVPFLMPCVSAIGELVQHYGVTAVLCTATQPALGRLFKQLAPTLVQREIAPDPDGLFDDFRRVSFRREGVFTPEELAARLAEAEQVLCIVNTRKRAQQVYEGLPEEGRFHLSTLMIPTDREETLNVIRARLRTGQVCRVVSTSLVEAGVDVDFPSVWRELAGLDSILQAAGRCNREGKRSAAESVVHVFEAEGTPPHAMIQQREATTKVMGEFEEINTRPAIRAYFDRLLWVKGDDALDAERILNSERACTFRKTAEAFRLIDADTCTVYVPNEGNAEDIAQLRAGLYSRALIRRLGRSSVNVYQNEYKNLVFAGIVEDHQEDGFGILIQPDAYKPKCGLSTEAGDGFLSK